MATPVDFTAFLSGEISPSLYGRVDIDKERIAASTARNMQCNFRGGLDSRAGTKFVGFSKQTGRNFPPRLITFQFNINQGLALEFGDHYMRVISDGAFVTEQPVAIGGVTKANPAVVTFGTEGATAGTPNDGAVTFSYAPGDLVTLMGGTFLTPAVVEVTTSQLVSILVNNHGTGYALGDTITLGGGTSSVAAIATVTAVTPIAATGSILFGVNPSDGDTITLNGVTWTFKTVVSAPAETAIFPTLAQTLAQLVTDLTASTNGSLTVANYSANAFSLFIVYKTTGTGGNAYTLAASVATPSAGTLTGGATTGLGAVSVTTPGVFSALPGGGNMTQTATSAGGTGATFQTAVFGPHAVTISNPGAYSSVPANPVAQASTTGIGVGATFNMTWAAVAPFANGDWVDINGAGGMTQLNGNTYVLASVTSTTAALLDVYGNQIDSTLFGTYTGGGTAARIFTLPTSYAEEDLPWLKVTQSADVMTLCCVNQDTKVEYSPQNLARSSDTDWTFSLIVATESVNSPAAPGLGLTAGGSYFYQYVITAVSAIDGTEGLPSAISTIESDITNNKDQIKIAWSPVVGANVYNVYKAAPSLNTPPPAGALFGYIGQAYGGGFTDQNLTPNFAQVPPLYRNPFAIGQIVEVDVITPGSGFTTATVTINTSTGSGAVLQPVIINGAVIAIIVVNAGHNYAPGDTVTITGGSGASAVLKIGPESGTYPSVPGYFQERRVFANSLNNPDTYWMSQPGAFLNFDVRIPTIDSDAVTGSPWAVLVDGIQFLVPTAGGLLVMTGESAWLLVGAGTFATNVQPISPSSQVANPQPFTGCSPKVPPVKVNYDVLYVTAKGSLVYDLPYQLYVLSEPIDLTQYSTHLFVGFNLLTLTWCEQPYKIAWAIRDDGTMLSLTYLKAEQTAGWARHDTNGAFVSTCSVAEPPVDALYLATQRFPGNKTAYMIERMDDRIWSTVEDCWCVDAGLTLSQPTPNATLTASSPDGIGSISGITNLVGGTSYSSATQVTIIDLGPQQTGAGATATPTIVNGVITAIAINTPGAAYTIPFVQIYDPENGGSGASASAALNSSATFSASTGVFNAGSIGSVIRMGGGVATITGFTDSQHVTGEFTQPIVAFRPNSGGLVMPQPPGAWTLTVPITVVTGLEYLAGATVTGLVDGNVITPRVVSATGTVTLDAPASAITIGLGFQAQMQSVYADTGAPTIQGQRKKVAEVSALLSASRGVKIGANQIDGSTLSPIQIAPTWIDMDPVPDLLPPSYQGSAPPLYTGWVTVPVSGGWPKAGQAAMQQDYPLPMQVVSLVPQLLAGDTPEQMVRPQQPQQQASQ